MNFNHLIGLPVAQAKKKCLEAGFAVILTEYEPNRKMEATDLWRVLRWREREGTVTLVVSPFLTEV